MKTLLPAVLTVLSFVLGGAVMFGLVQARVVASPVDPTGLPEHSHGEAADGDIGVSLGEYLKLPKMPKILPRQTSRIIYLNREGVRLRPGTDNAAHNESSIVRGSGLEVADVPAFSGSQRSWRRIVKCLESKFKPFGVVVTDQRPVHSDNYIMATFGGTARLLGRTRKSSSHTGGLAPFNSRSIPGAVVFIFSSTLRNHTTRICETAGMEIAHAYGLDHGYHCRDLMTYKPRCGTRRFVDKTVRCGENKPRDCANGERTQNSYRHLLDLLGPKARAKASAHKH